MIYCAEYNYLEHELTKGDFCMAFFLFVVILGKSLNSAFAGFTTLK